MLNHLRISSFGALFDGIFDIGRARYSYFQKADDDGIKMVKRDMSRFRIVDCIFSTEILLINEIVKRGPAENQAFSAQSLWKIPMKIHVLFDGKTRHVAF